MPVTAGAVDFGLVPSWQVDLPSVDVVLLYHTLPDLTLTVFYAGHGEMRLDTPTFYLVHMTTTHHTILHSIPYHMHSKHTRVMINVNVSKRSEY